MVAAVALAFVGIAMNGWFARSLGSSEAAGWLLLAIRHGAADAVTDRRQTFDTVMRSVEQSAQPQTEAAIRMVAWASRGMLRPAGDDFAMLRLGAAGTAAAGRRDTIDGWALRQQLKTFTTGTFHMPRAWSAGPRTSSPICVLARHGQPISGQRRATVPSSDLRNVLQTSRLSGRPAARPLGRRGSRHGPACSTQD